MRRKFRLRRACRKGDRRPVVWLSGIGRVGETALAHIVPGAESLTCELPSVRRTLGDAELYLDGRAGGTTLNLDRIRCLEERSLLPQIIAGEHSQVVYMVMVLSIWPSV